MKLRFSVVRTLDDLSINGDFDSEYAQIFVSRQSYEYIDTGTIMDVVSKGEPLPLISAEQALKGVADQLKLDYYWIHDGEQIVKGPASIERIELVYEPKSMREDEFLPYSDTYIPTWLFTFLRGMEQPDTSDWRSRTLDNWAFLLTIRVDALTGKLVYETQM